MLHHPIILMILDGWGIARKGPDNPISAARTPNLDLLFSCYPHSQLSASGLNVGLPRGAMGSSEVGHLTLGAGRVIDQDLVRINKACVDGSLKRNHVLQKAFKQAKRPGVALHLIGLVSDGGVHSSDKHLHNLCSLAKEAGLKKVFIHAITDGRDTDPHSAPKFIRRLEKKLLSSTGQIATLIGRYYAMDRDKHWERIKLSYDLMVKGKGEKTNNLTAAIKDQYSRGLSDEFLLPLVRVGSDKNPVGLIRPGDVVICFNFRAERLQEITAALTQLNFPRFRMNKLPLHYYTMTPYGDFPGITPIFPKENIVDTLGEVISRRHYRQLRIAETEKYAHVTFFFSGGRQEMFPGEKRILINSPRVATYDLKPEMSAFAVVSALEKSLASQRFDFVCLNLVNGDMVGHTGKFAAIKKAVEAVDTSVGRIYKAAKRFGYEIVLVADHGNAEQAINRDGTPNTTHSLNPVPCLIVSDRYRRVRSGSLADIAPTVLKMMDIKQPRKMTGQPLV